MVNFSLLKKRPSRHITIPAFLFLLMLLGVGLSYFFAFKPSPNCQCLGPDFWSICTNGSQTRNNYECDSSTNYQCISFVEGPRACTFNYSLTITATIGGTTTPKGTVGIVAGNNVTVTAAANSGYYFRDWIFNGQTINTSFPTITLNLTNDSILQAVFALNQPPPPPPPPGTQPVLQWYDVPQTLEGNQSTTISSCFILGNPGQVDVTNVSLALTGIDPSWYSLLPDSFQDLSPGLNASVCISLGIPSDASVQDYPSQINASDSTSVSANFVLKVDRYIYPKPPPQSLSFNISTCGDIVSGGNYFLSQDIIGKTPNVASLPWCLSIQTQGVDLNCYGHSITGNGSMALNIKNSENFSVENCSIQSIGDQSWGTPMAISIESSGVGNITGNKIGSYYITARNTSNLLIAGNIVNGFYQQGDSSFNTILNNTIMVNYDLPGAAVIVSDLGTNNKIINNFLNGRWNGSGGGGNGFPPGADDGIVLDWENFSNVSFNTVLNVWDCGLENVGLVKGNTITGNTFSHLGYCGIGGWYFNSWLNNTISSNTINNSPSMFTFFRVFGLITNSSYGPIEDKLYFADNAFTGNSFTNPVQSIFNSSEIIMVPTNNSYNSWTRNISASDTVTENNVFTMNDFTRTAPAPLFDPYSMIIDGGRNSCSRPADTTNYPLNCWRGH